jgi:pilus assembly protein CpaB
MLVVVLLGAVVFGLIAATSVSSYLSGATDGSKLGGVVVAKMEIALGEKIVAEKLTVVQLASNATPEGAFDSIEKVTGRVSATRIAPREPVTNYRLAPEGSTAGLSALIPEGYRAMTVNVDDEAGIAGFLMPGTLVDVLAVINPPNEYSGQNPISKIVLQNIKVLASGRNLDQPEDGREAQSVKTATLLVTPEQAEKLVLSSIDGKLRLALRNSIDQGDQQTQGANKNTLLSGMRALPLPNSTPSNQQRETERRQAAGNAIRPIIASIGDKAVPVAPSPTPTPTPRASVEVYEGQKKRAIDFP